MIALIPMAGEGSRYKKEGYTTPKPLIPILEKPMVVRAVEALPNSQKQIFICRDFHIKEYQIDQEIKKYYPQSEIITIDKLTEGQASTCLLAKDFINNDEELIIGASDNGMIWDRNTFDNVKQDADCIVFTFRNNVTVVPKPEQYGWVEANDTGDVSKVSVKVPISDTPINDHAIIGAFWFKKGVHFVEAAEKMIKENRRINNEFYVDECINDLVELGYKVKVFEVDHYICWGTPNDFRTFEYWQTFFRNADFHSYS